MTGLRIMAARKMDINDFNARIKQIQNPRNNSYFDPDLGMHVPKRVKRERVKRTVDEESLVGMLLVSMILGAIGLMFAQIVRIRYFGLLETSTIVLFLELAMTFWAVILLTALTNKRTIAERLAQIAGVAVMMVAGHNLIWRWPDQMAMIYTSAYVEQILEDTTQHSIVYRGSVYGL
jgi:hypothetical protein